MKELSQRNHQIRARVINEHWNSDQVSFSPRFSCTLFMHCAYQQKTTNLRYKTSSSNMSYGLEKKPCVCVSEGKRGKTNTGLMGDWRASVSLSERDISKDAVQPISTVLVSISLVTWSCSLEADNKLSPFIDNLQGVLYINMTLIFGNSSANRHFWDAPHAVTPEAIDFPELTKKTWIACTL